MAPRNVRTAVLAAALASTHAMSVEQVPSGLRLRGGVDLTKFAQTVAGVFNKAPEAFAAEGQANLGLKGGEAVSFDEIRTLMAAENLSESAIGAFKQAYEQLVRGDDGMILEKDISPSADVPVMSDIKGGAVDAAKAKEVMQTRTHL